MQGSEGWESRRFETTPGYRKAERVQRAAVVGTYPTLLLGLPAVSFLFPRIWAISTVLLLAGGQVLVFIVAEGWKTASFGRAVFRHVKGVGIEPEPAEVTETESDDKLNRPGIAGDSAP